MPHHSTALVIGGTRNLGPGLVHALIGDGYCVTVFHRGLTHSAALPPAEIVERLYGDRSDERSLAAALTGREFDVVIDTTLYNGPDAEALVRVLGSRTLVRRRYLMLSTGQVYLVRSGLQRPFIERDYAGDTIPAPPASNDFDFENWSYGVNKRAAEDALAAAPFPVTILRLPMVNSELDHHHRLRNYLARVADGGPILIPEGPHLPLRHVYGPDVVRAVLRTIEAGVNGAFNVGQDESVTIEEFLARIGGRALRMPAGLLWKHGLLPACSPFSEPWMSSLDNTLGKLTLGLAYTPFAEYLDELIRGFDPSAPVPGAFRESRQRELAFLARHG